mgnify:CR=1 FL=1
MTDAAARDALCSLGRSLFERGLTHGSTGNLSVRTDDGYLLTPTGSSLGALDPARLSLLDANGVHVRGDVSETETVVMRSATGTVRRIKTTFRTLGHRAFI